MDSTENNPDDNDLVRRMAETVREQGDAAVRAGLAYLKTLADANGTIRDWEQKNWLPKTPWPPNTPAYLITYVERNSYLDANDQMYPIGIASSLIMAQERLTTHLKRAYPGREHTIERTMTTHDLEGGRKHGQTVDDEVLWSFDGMGAFVGANAYLITGFMMDGELQ